MADSKKEAADKLFEKNTKRRKKTPQVHHVASVDAIVKPRNDRSRSVTWGE